MHESRTPLARLAARRPFSVPRFLLLAALLASFTAPGCRSLSYEEPDAPPVPPPRATPKVTGSPSSTTSTSRAAPADTWSAHANAARMALREGDLEESEREFMATIAATAQYPPRDVRRLTALAIPTALVERLQASERHADAARVMDAVLAESQGGQPFPLDAWAPALETRLDLARVDGGPTAELELAARIAEIHLGPFSDATLTEVTLRQRVGRLLAANTDDAAMAATQLGWAARAAEPMLRLPLAERLALLYEAAEFSRRADDPTTSDFLLRDAVDLARTSDPRGVATAEALNARGWFLLEQGRPHVALPLLEESAAILASRESPAVIDAAVLDSLALALLRVGRPGDAAVVIDQALTARARCTPEEQAQLSELDDHQRDIERALGPLELPASSLDPADAVEATGASDASDATGASNTSDAVEAIGASNAGL